MRCDLPAYDRTVSLETQNGASDGLTITGHLAPRL